METIIDLRKPTKRGWEGKGFGRRFLFTYVCGQGHTVKVRANSFRGKTPVPSCGAIACPPCSINLPVSV